MAYIIFLLYPWFKPGQFLASETVHRLVRWFSFHLSLLCLAYVTIETFRRYLDKQGTLSRELNRNCYYVYIIHTVVIGGLALLLLNTELPSLLKYLILTVSTFAASNGIVSLSRRIVTSSRNRIRRSVLMHGEEVRWC
jgi:fucose 4-O-acetylase-like acetyltransferase